MSVRSKSNSSNSQAKKIRALEKKISKAKTAKNEARTRAKYKAASQKLETAKLELTLIRAKQLGIYSPKADNLTKYRKTRLRKISAEFESFFDKRKFAFISFPSDDKKKVETRAKGLDYRTTKTGFFIPTNNYGKLTLKKDKKRNEYYIERTGKTKWGENKGRKYRSVSPLASIDELEAEKDRIRNLAKKLGPLSKNEDLAFEIVEKGNEGFSHSTFSDVELLLQYLEQYQKSMAAKLQFFRHINIVKTESIQKWIHEHPVKPPKRFARRIHTKVNAKGRNV